MEYAGFLNVPHQNDKYLNIISWNINGVRTKLDKQNVNDFLIYYDIICVGYEYLMMVTGMTQCIYKIVYLSY